MDMSKMDIARLWVKVLAVAKSRCNSEEKLSIITEHCQDVFNDYTKSLKIKNSITDNKYVVSLKSILPKEFSNEYDICAASELTASGVYNRKLSYFTFDTLDSANIFISEHRLEPYGYKPYKESQYIQEVHTLAYKDLKKLCKNFNISI